jgi:hypothetical protein
MIAGAAHMGAKTPDFGEQSAKPYVTISGPMQIYMQQSS